MNVSDYDYELPEERIALYPPRKRGGSKLLVLDRSTGGLQHRKYGDFVEFLQAGDVVVINDTKVIKARLITKSSAGKDRELLLLEKHRGDEDWHTHKALHKGSVRQGEVLKIAGVDIEVSKTLGGGIVELHSQNDLLDLAQKHGSVPLPPYMKRAASAEDIDRYQTEFAKTAGSVAAPTASLNLTRDIITQLEDKGVVVSRVTLHVGMGTFLPIRSNDMQNHVMHKEYFETPPETASAIRKAKSAGKRVVPIGTTVTRALEYAAADILNGTQSTISGEADIFIYPGYTFKIIDALLTNFHAPRSTVLMMAAAFAGKDNLFSGYREALARDYTFLSYGDSMLIL